MQRITDVKCTCSCGWQGAVGDCEPDVDGDGSLGCPKCKCVVTVPPFEDTNVLWMGKHFAFGRKFAATCLSCGAQVTVGWLRRHIEVCPGKK